MGYSLQLGDVQHGLPYLQISGYLARAFQFDGVTLSVAKGYCLDLGRPTRRDCLQ